MYKKITHSIVEEHFGHPDAVHIKSGIDLNDPNVAPQPWQLGSTWGTRARNQITRFNWNIRNYIVSATSGAEDVGFLRGELPIVVAEITALIALRYSQPEADKVAVAMTGFVNALADVITAAVAKKDTAPPTTKLMEYASAIATELGAINPIIWPMATIQRYWGEYATHSIEEVNARIQKDWRADFAAHDLANDVMARQIIPSGPLQGQPGFANVFAQGIME